VSTTAVRSPEVAATAPYAGTRQRRTELAAFLRSRRERIRPEDVGYPPGPRRRTPGLRREEVAQLAGVGVTWYTWLEQGRDINVSTQVLDSIARTLRLDRTERSHLYLLAGFNTGPTEPECSAISDAHRAMLSKLLPYPAAVLTARFDVLAYNEAYRHLVLDLDEVPLGDRNLLVLAFTYPDWLCRFTDSCRADAYLVASFRAAMAGHLSDQRWTDLADRLRAESPRFAELWEHHEVAGPSNRVKVIDSPRAGTLRLEPVNLWLAPDSSRRLVCYTPSDEETAAQLEKLVDPA
jgi:transcriptional regulator with XRE-family HTH domain